MSDVHGPSFSKQEGWLEIRGLHSRIESLERSRLRGRLITAALGITLIGSAWLLGQNSDRRQTVRAEGFEVIDKAGKARASLELVKDIPQLVLRDQNSARRLVLQVESNGDPAVCFNDEREIARANLALGAGRYPFMQFFDPKTADPKISMGITERGEAFLTVYDYNKNEYVKIPSENH